MSAKPLRTISLPATAENIRVLQEQALSFSYRHSSDQTRYRHFELKPEDAQGIAEALIREMQHWGGFLDLWHAMIPEGQAEFKAAIAKLIRKHVNQIARGVK